MLSFKSACFGCLSEDGLITSGTVVYSSMLSRSVDLCFKKNVSKKVCPMLALALQKQLTVHIYVNLSIK